MAITFQNADSNFRLTEKTKTKKWLNELAAKHKKKIGDINYVFTNDQNLLNYNQQYLNHQTFTDIITFDNSIGNMLAGDILISIERVYDNAKKFQVTNAEELKRVMAHGLLHLAGFKDKLPADIKKMRQQEALALKLWQKID